MLRIGNWKQRIGPCHFNIFLRKTLSSILSQMLSFSRRDKNWVCQSRETNEVVRVRGCGPRQLPFASPVLFFNLLEINSTLQRNTPLFSSSSYLQSSDNILGKFKKILNVLVQYISILCAHTLTLIAVSLQKQAGPWKCGFNCYISIPMLQVNTDYLFCNCCQSSFIFFHFLRQTPCVPSYPITPAFF